MVTKGFIMLLISRHVGLIKVLINWPKEPHLGADLFYALGAKCPPQI